MEIILTLHVMQCQYNVVSYIKYNKNNTNKVLLVAVAACPLVALISPCIRGNVVASVMKPLLAFVAGTFVAGIFAAICFMSSS